MLEVVRRHQSLNATRLSFAPGHGRVANDGEDRKGEEVALNGALENPWEEGVEGP